MRLFLGDNYLRLQTPLHFASDDMDDASKGNIRNLKQTARELIAKEEGALQRFLAVGQSAVEGVFKEMKWLLTAIALVVAVAVWSLLDPVVEPSAPSLPASSDDLPSFVEPEPEAESLIEMTPRPEVVPASESEPADDGVINIGEPMDPDDPSTWPQPENTEVINIGEPMDLTTLNLASARAPR